MSAPAATQNLPGIHAWRQAKFREFAIFAEQAQGRFLLDKLSREWIIAAGAGYPRIQCASNAYDTQDPAEIRASIEAHASLLEEFHRERHVPQNLTPETLQGWHGRITAPQKYHVILRPNGEKARIPLIRGAWKTRRNYKISASGRRIEFCRPEDAEAEVRAFLTENEHQVHRKPAEQAIWQFHHLHRIHPFQDGNTRTSFMLMANTLIRAGLPPIIPDPKNTEEFMAWRNAMDKDNLEELTHTAMETLRNTQAEWDKAESEIRKGESAALKGSGGIAPNGYCIRPDPYTGRTISCPAERREEFFARLRESNKPFPIPQSPNAWEAAIAGEMKLPRGCRAN